MIIPNRAIGAILRILIITVGLSMPRLAMGQQIDQIGRKDAVRVNGGLDVNQVYRSNATGGTNPYSLVVTGRATGSLWGMSVPVSFTWSNYQWTYTQPFNQFSLSPSYKWVMAHLGWSSMGFSPYSLNGHSFAGVGVDLTPTEKLKISAMYGRLLKETAGDTLQGYMPQYRRTGTGLKAQYGFSFGEVGVHVFYASDDPHEPVSYIDSLGITPRDNLVVGTTFSVRPTRSIAVRGEVGVSSLSEDLRISKATDFNGAATFRHHAARCDVSWSNPLGSVGAGVEYVEPGYNTLGSYYMVNDFINYTLNLATSMLKGKVSAVGSIGVRETNLDGKSETDQRDVVKNINLNFVPTEKLNFSASYSNFYNYSFVRPLFDETNTHTEYELLDTLKFTQINENIGLNGNWRIRETETQKHGLNAGINFQQATQAQGDAVENANTSFVNASGGYSWALPKADFSLGLNMNYSRNKAPGQVSEAYGPLLSLRKGMFDKKLRNTLSVSWNGTYVDGDRNGDVLTARLGCNYTLKKKHRFTFSTAWSARHRQQGTGSSYYTATLGYSYQFGWPKQGEKQKDGPSL